MQFCRPIICVPGTQSTNSHNNILANVEMSKRYVQRQTDPEFRNRLLVLAFGAVPATLTCGFALLAFIVGIASLPSPAGFLMVFLGGAGILGTYSLWMIVFGFWSRIIAFGLVAGIVAMLPLLLVKGLPFAEWFGVSGATLLKLSPLIVALVWLSLSPKATHGAPRTRKELAMGGIAVMASLTIPALFILAPIWATPLAKVWYKRGFEGAVTAALTDIPGNETACIYDDSRNIFVTSVGQLNVDRMIEKAVQDKALRPRRRLLQRDPHFRVYSAGRTYYWSFRQKELHAFRGDRWTLTSEIERTCDAYKQHPRSFEQAYRERDGITVTEENFCCKSGQETRF